MISLVPMAGGGTRFVSEGYNLPKPFIPIMGQPMFVAAVKSFPPAEKVIFVCQERFLTRYPFAEEVDKHFDNAIVRSVPGLTEGQASTCLSAKEDLEPNSPLLISSIDYQLVYDDEAFKVLSDNDSVDIVIFTLQIKNILANDVNGFAYCRMDGERVVEVVEKKTISSRPWEDQAVAGTFYYRRAADFVRGAEAMIKKDIRVNNEFYVGTSINQLIQDGMNVRIFPLGKFVSFGNPFELELYQFWEEYFYKESYYAYNGWEGQ